MSDFTDDFWSYYIAVLTLGGIVACLLLLWFSSKARVVATSDNSTGHVWDGDLREMNNPLPRWWAWLFVITIVFSLVYLVLFPGLGSHTGSLKWTSGAEYRAEVDQIDARVAPLYARFSSLPLQDVARDGQAMAMGERLYMNNCAQCHASDARGAKGIPNLTDGDWLHGGSAEAIKETLAKGRVGNMPPMAAIVGGAADVKNLAHYVLSLSGSPHDSLLAALGKSKFTTCAACHGVDGKGNTALGAPNLTDDIWLHGYGEATIIAIINEGKVNAMPAQADRLSGAQIHVLAAYVLGLSSPATAPKPP